MGDWISNWIMTVPPLAVYISVGLIIMIESLGIPMPGEFALVGATLLTLQPNAQVQWGIVAACASAGAIIGDSIGYTIGRKGTAALIHYVGKVVETWLSGIAL
jgi:membrane protein DedA with SNARE-associated domain